MRAWLIATVAAALAIVPSAVAAKPVKTPPGYDVSYPQCGSSLPVKAAFAIVGVNRGIVYSANPCLASELAWAQQFEPTAILYANTANPGPTLSSHWPTGQTAPQYCDPLQPDSGACSFDYGWNAAADSYADAVNAGAIQPTDWWLDVETANSWEPNTANNVYALQGEVAYLQSQGVTSIGIYANASDWQTITGNTAAFASLPSWRPGAGSQRNAQSYCGASGVTGGAIKYSQYASNGFDADVRC